MTQPASLTTSKAPVKRVEVSSYRVPTQTEESDGTLAWDQTTVVVGEVHAAGEVGLGYTYADVAVGSLIESKLSSVVEGLDALSPQSAWEEMVKALRNLGRPGISSMAVAVIDCALWDLKAKLLGLPLAQLLGPMRESVRVYGSGGFTSYSIPQLCAQLGEWVDRGIDAVKMKVGRWPDQDPERVRCARKQIGAGADLFVDANGAYQRKQALAMAEAFSGESVTWFEEPVTSDDLEGLRLLRDRAPARMQIAAGEYGYDIFYFKRMLDAGAVDVLQADATRCAGITEFLRVDSLCRARALPMSAHTAPALHLHPCAACGSVIHIEYFHDHVQIENLLFDGVKEPDQGALAFDSDRPGLGLELKRSDAEPYRL
jgi:L-alanine-DL-glutamate epimerase-like enolase superfamily enzyme